jgi:hypothetical protein
MNAPNFFIEPLVLKNPYTNVPFKKSDLYNIYFFLKQSPILMPILFHNYFLVDFNLRVFRDENENTIRNMYIKSAIRNSTPDILYSNIIRMLKKYQPEIIIDKDFPKDILANIMAPYLELFYIIRYSTEEYRIIDATSKILYKLHRLYKHNPAFGRKIVCLKREWLSTRMIRTISFNDNHIPFDEAVDTTVYQQYHLELIEANYTIETDTDEDDDDDETENTSDEIMHAQYVIISANPSFHMTEPLFTVVANNTNPEYTESENTTENPNEDESENDEPDEVVIEDSSQNDESDAGDGDESDADDGDGDI